MKLAAIILAAIAGSACATTVPTAPVQTVQHTGVIKQLAIFAKLDYSDFDRRTESGSIIISDIRGTVLETNSGTVEFYGVCPDEFLDTPVTVTLEEMPDDPTFTLKECIEAKPEAGYQTDRENRIVIGKIVSVDNVAGFMTDDQTHVQIPVSTVENDQETLQFFGICNELGVGETAKISLTRFKKADGDDIGKLIKDEAQWSKLSCKPYVESKGT